MSKEDVVKVPKTIAGVKIPKALRKSGLLDALITTPEGRAVVAKASAAAVEAGLAVLLEWASSDDSLDGEHAENSDRSKEVPTTSETEKRRRPLTTLTELKPRSAESVSRAVKGAPNLTGR